MTSKFCFDNLYNGVSQQIYNIVVYTEYTVFPRNVQMYRTVTLVYLLPIRIGGEVGHCFHTHLDVFTILRQNEDLWERVTP